MKKYQKGCIPNCTISDSQLSSKNPRPLKEGTFIRSQVTRPECPVFWSIRPTLWHLWPSSPPGYVGTGDPTTAARKSTVTWRTASTTRRQLALSATFSLISVQHAHHPLAFLHAQPFLWRTLYFRPKKALPMLVEGHPKMKTPFKCQFPSDLTWEISLSVFNGSSIILERPTN